MSYFIIFMFWHGMSFQAFMAQINILNDKDKVKFLLVKFLQEFMWITYLVETQTYISTW